MDAYAGNDGISAALVECAGSSANRDYEGRVLEWISRGSAIGAKRDEKAQRAVAAANARPRKSPDEMSDDEIYEAATGEYDRLNAAAAAEKLERRITGSTVGEPYDPELVALRRQRAEAAAKKRPGQ